MGRGGTRGVLQRASIIDVIGVMMAAGFVAGLIMIGVGAGWYHTDDTGWRDAALTTCQITSVTNSACTYDCSCTYACPAGVSDPHCLASRTCGSCAGTNRAYAASTSTCTTVSYSEGCRPTTSTQEFTVGQSVSCFVAAGCGRFQSETSFGEDPHGDKDRGRKMMVAGGILCGCCLFIAIVIATYDTKVAKPAFEERSKYLHNIPPTEYTESLQAVMPPPTPRAQQPDAAAAG
eukprot:TRINITY_DN5796_c1_g1_i1.p2 TRINITY_DN5796_c1_g1~~TRINITY_DN5796_c1_g1_i1.p2  ORF type:complete len:233 (+),score=22.22 TRINITY_DN5796_c1_g1_i1:98-796(+)